MVFQNPINRWLSVYLSVWYYVFKWELRNITDSHQYSSIYSTTRWKYQIIHYCYNTHFSRGTVKLKHICLQEFPRASQRLILRDLSWRINWGLAWGNSLICLWYSWLWYPLDFSLPPSSGWSSIPLSFSGTAIGSYLSVTEYEWHCLT